MKKLYHFLVTSYKLQVTSYKLRVTNYKLHAPHTSHLTPLTSYLIPLFAFCIFSAQAQNSFPTSNAIWNESIYTNGVKHEYLYGLLGDTIINEKLYSKLFEFSDTLLLVENIRGYIGALRNEEQKVFFKPVNWEYSDILLYDFGAEVGDTVWHNAFLNYFEFQNNEYYLVEHCMEQNCFSTIKGITIENDRKIFQVSYRGWWDGSWIEGIGCERGLLRSLITKFPMFMSPYDFILNCYKHNDTVKYLNNPSCNICFCSALNITEKTYFDRINIFPNPFKDIVNIEIPNNIKIKSINIYSIDGKKTYFSDSRQLNISNLKNGIYIINVETDKFNYKQLIIKQ